MRFDRLHTFGIVGGFVLTLGVPGIVRSNVASATPVRAAAMVADDKKNTDKKEEEPKGDPVDVDKLPKAVVDAVKKDMPGARITKAAKLEDGNFYLDDVKVGKKLWDVTVSPQGKIIKKVEMKD